MKHFIYNLLILLCITSFTADAAKDSVIVVKGQISDYIITIPQTHTVKGHLYDSKGSPIKDGTVMFKASPVHCNTDNTGFYEVISGRQDTMLMIYAPGKEVIYYNVGENDGTIDITLEDTFSTKTYNRGKGIATPWFDPENDHPSTYCNPMNISYNFEPYNNNVQPNGSFRSAADPMVVNYKGEYYLFSTNQGGFHWSKDLSTWHFVFTGFQRTPVDDDQCAPAAYVIGDTLFYTGSTYEGLPIWYSTNPKSGKFKRYVEKTILPSWDPGFLYDNDNRLYLYYGSSNEYALKGVEVNPNNMLPISKIHEIMHLEPKIHGWERFGMNNDDSTTLAPFTEGAWVNKYNGKYYFQYGAPGTEFKVYADGVYVGDAPLGPYTYQKHNPMSYKPGGFVLGAGHGGTFADNYDNYWHVATCMLSLKYKFERRIGLYPTGFDKDGVMYCITSFGDYPTFTPKEKTDHTKGCFTGWMLLSFRKKMTASSSDGTHTSDLASDENMRTYWSAESNNPGEWLIQDLGKEMEVRAIQVNYYDHKAFQHNKAMDIYHQYRIYHSINGTDWELVVDKSDNDTDIPHDYVELQKPLYTRYLKIENIHMPTGLFAISDFRVFGNAKGKAPDAVNGFKVNRSKTDPRDGIISWNKVPDAYGYNIYFGVEPDKLYSCITVYDDTSYDFRGMDIGTDYYFAIEALNENGRSVRSKVLKR
ncbi:MAG: discoidin domain-containing protein [Bacteroidales bacterium]|nr:discoidin domain-containing protein [Bacteroidales bacterium]